MGFHRAYRPLADAKLFGQPVKHVRFGSTVLRCAAAVSLHKALLQGVVP